MKEVNDWAHEVSIALLNISESVIKVMYGMVTFQWA